MVQNAQNGQTSEGLSIKFLKMETEKSQKFENSSKWSKMAKNGEMSKGWSQCAVH